MSACNQYAPVAGRALLALQKHLPTGLAWDAYRIIGKTAYRLWSSFAHSYDDMSEALCRLIGELDPYTTVELIDEWERAVGLPDDCLPRGKTLGERRFWVLFRLGRKRWTTIPEWIALARLFGLEIRVTPGWYVQKPALYAAEYPKRYDLFPKLGRFRAYIDVFAIPYEGYDYGKTGRGRGYPIPYGTGSESYKAFQCILERVAPANVVLIWNNNPLSTNTRFTTTVSATGSMSVAISNGTQALGAQMSAAGQMTATARSAAATTMTGTGSLSVSMRVGTPILVGAVVTGTGSLGAKLAAPMRTTLNASGSLACTLESPDPPPPGGGGDTGTGA